MKKEHTPGPWSYDSDEDEIHADTMISSDGDPTHICGMMGLNQMANGRLIAAAPELLNACERALTLLLYVSAAVTSAEIEREITYLKAVISKSKGDQE